MSTLIERFAVDRSDTALLVIDVQQKLHPAIDERYRASIAQNLGRLGTATRILQVPRVLTEQYPKGLGPTISEVGDAFEGESPFAKMSFDALADPAIAARIAELGRRTVLVTGVETHICVLQTVRGLIARGHLVHVVSDAVGARARHSHDTGLGICRELGAVITTTETVLFDMLGGAGTEEFKAISRLVR